MAVAVRPNGSERRFGTEEIIVSKTDPKGRITYANDVFIRVCKYSQKELLGAPHSIIRHPDMPGGVFKLLWETIEAGDEIFAYVQNLAADGACYWVLAHVTPTFDSAGRIIGHHSSRRSPDPSVVAAITPLYDQLRALERQIPNKAQAAVASKAALVEELARREQTYEEFVWDLINREGRA